MEFQKVEPKRYKMWANDTDWVIASSLEEANQVAAEQYGYSSAQEYINDYGADGWECLDMDEHFRMCETDGTWSDALKVSGIDVPRPKMSWVSITARVRNWIDYLGHKPQFVASTEY